MAKDNVYAYSATPASNTDIDGLDSTGATGLVKSGDNYTRSMMSHLKAFTNDLGGVVTVGGTGDAQTVTLAEPIAALATGMVFGWKAPGTNTGAATATLTNSAATLLGTPKIRRKGDTALQANDMIAGGFYLFRYDAAYDAAAGALVLLNPEAPSSVPYTAASASGAASLQFAEDTDNGSNKITLRGAASVASDATVTLPAGDMDMTDWRSGQIKFPATQNASADANTLDDYEEGTFTPTADGTSSAGTGTYSLQFGRYTKIGRLVSYEITLTWGGHTGTGNIIVSGLPFTSSNATAGVNAPSGIVASGLTFSNQLVAYVPANSTQVQIRTMASGAGVGDVAMDTSASLFISGSYVV